MFVQQVLFQLFKESQGKFPHARQVKVSISPTEGTAPKVVDQEALLFEECSALVTFVNHPLTPQLTLAAVPKGAVPETQPSFSALCLLIVNAGPFIVEPREWRQGMGYRCRDDIRIHYMASTLPISTPALELCGYLTARLYQLVKEIQLKIDYREVWEVGIWPHGDYTRPSQQNGGKG